MPSQKTITLFHKEAESLFERHCRTKILHGTRRMNLLCNRNPLPYHHHTFQEGCQHGFDRFHRNHQFDLIHFSQEILGTHQIENLTEPLINEETVQESSCPTKSIIKLSIDIFLRRFLEICKSDVTPVPLQELFTTTTRFQMRQIIDV